MISGGELVLLGFEYQKDITGEYLYKKVICSDDPHFALYTHLFTPEEESEFHKVFANIHGGDGAEKFLYMKSSYDVRRFIHHCKEIDKMC